MQVQAANLLRDPKAWLYFGAAACSTLAAVVEMPWYCRAVFLALGNGFLAVKAYTSPTGSALTPPPTNVPPPPTPQPPA